MERIQTIKGSLLCALTSSYQFIVLTVIIFNRKYYTDSINVHNSKISTVEDRALSRLHREIYVLYLFRTPIFLALSLLRASLKKIISLTFAYLTVMRDFLETWDVIGNKGMRKHERRKMVQGSMWQLSIVRALLRGTYTAPVSR
uniref:Lipocalin/cytosolic fatty-acid binding domain-containing protein n=1 Tax=Parascaris univalens TaxID=6257 RepID=A0A915BBG3_PARUN